MESKPVEPGEGDGKIVNMEREVRKQTLGTGYRVTARHVGPDSPLHN